VGSDRRKNMRRFSREEQLFYQFVFKLALRKTAKNLGVNVTTLIREGKRNKGRMAFKQCIAKMPTIELTFLQYTLLRKFGQLNQCNQFAQF
jgi:hypothetical protein